MHRHFDKTAKGRDREGYVVGGVQKPRPSGFTEDTKVSNPLDKFVDERVSRHHLDGYQVRYIYIYICILLVMMQKIIDLFIFTILGAYVLEIHFSMIQHMIAKEDCKQSSTHSKYLRKKR